jgi:hypothetical protein
MTRCKGSKLMAAHAPSCSCQQPAIYLSPERADFARVYPYTATADGRHKRKASVIPPIATVRTSKLS